MLKKTGAINAPALNYWKNVRENKTFFESPILK